MILIIVIIETSSQFFGIELVTPYGAEAEPKVTYIDLLKLLNNIHFTLWDDWNNFAQFGRIDAVTIAHYNPN